MPYAPKYAPGESITRTASATITEGQMVVVSGSGTVAPSGANSAAWLGVAAHDAANGDKVTIRAGGVQRPIASGAITAGDLVATATTGRVATNAAPGAGVQVGVALNTVADGAAVDVAMVR